MTAAPERGLGGAPERILALLGTEDGTIDMAALDRGRRVARTVARATRTALLFRFMPQGWLVLADLRRRVREQVLVDLPGATVSWGVHWFKRILPAPLVKIHIPLEDPVEDLKRVRNLIPWWEDRLQA